MYRQSVLYVPKNMGDEAINYIVNSFNELMGTRVDFRIVRKSSIIGGFSAEIEGEIFDMSMGSRLSELKKIFSERTDHED